MNDNSNINLNRFFTRSILMDLINNQESNLYNQFTEQFLYNDKSNTHNELISQVYKHLNKQYRNEYFYKNTLLNKLLLGRHSLNTTTALNEIPVNKSKADFILINGKATVYEIKTELDSLERLESQINDYYKAFNHVCVVTGESNFEKAYNLLKDTDVGVCVLTDRNTISTRKEPIKSNKKLDHTIMFKVLRKKEYENILFRHYGNLPETSQIKYFRACLELFRNIEMDRAYDYMVDELKKRNIKEVDEYKKVPYELKFLVYFSDFKKRDYMKLQCFLNEKWRE